MFPPSGGGTTSSSAAFEELSTPPGTEKAASSTLTPVTFDSEDERSCSFDSPDYLDLRWSDSNSNGVARTPVERRSSITGRFLDFLTDSAGMQSSRRHSYEITLEQYHKMTILFSEDDMSRVIIKSFGVSNSRDDAALDRLADLVHVGDVVTAINGVSTDEIDFQDFLETFSVRKAAGEPNTLFLSPSEHMKGRADRKRDESDVLEAKRWIQAYKSRFYTAPPEVGEKLIQCYLVRHRGKFLHSFHLMREDTEGFILAATCESNMKSGFVFSTLQHTHLLKSLSEIPTEDECAAYVGCMTNNYLCTEFVVHDHTIKAQGLYRGRLPPQQERGTGSQTMVSAFLNALRARLPSPKELVMGTTDVVLGADGLPHECGLVAYDLNISGSIPNFMKILLPRRRAHAYQEYVDPIFPSKPAPPPPSSKPSIVSSAESFATEHESMSFTTDDLTSYFDETQSKDARSLADRYRQARQTRSLSMTERLERLSSSFGNFTGSRPSEDRGLGYHEAEVPTGDYSYEDSYEDAQNSFEYGQLEQDDLSDLLVLETKRPQWSDELQAWTLNFEGRVKLASKKNFLIGAERGNVHTEHELGEEGVYLRFGKVSKTKFSLDFRAPVSPVLALGIACSAFADKKVVA